MNIEPGSPKSESAPLIELMHYRSPDYSCSTRLFIDGNETAFIEYNIDPGSGHEFCDYAQSLAADVAQASPNVAELLWHDAMAAFDDGHVDDVPQDPRVVQRYFDLCVAHSREVHQRQQQCHHPANAREPHRYLPTGWSNCGLCGLDMGPTTMSEPGGDPMNVSGAQ